MSASDFYDAVRYVHHVVMSSPEFQRFGPDVAAEVLRAAAAELAAMEKGEVYANCLRCSECGKIWGKRDVNISTGLCIECSPQTRAQARSSTPIHSRGPIPEYVPTPEQISVAKKQLRARW